MKAPFHIEFQTEFDENNNPTVRDGYFMVDIDASDSRQLTTLANFLVNDLDNIRDGFESDFGAHDIQLTPGTLISWTSCDIEAPKFKQLVRKWKRAFEHAGFVTGDPQVVSRSEFQEVLSNQNPEQRATIDALANGEAPEPRQEAFSFKM